MSKGKKKTDDHDARKKRRKSIDIARNEHKQIVDDIKNLSGKEKIEYDISVLKKIIKNCEYDLNNNFKGNTVIINKLSITKQQLYEKEKQLENGC